MSVLKGRLLCDPRWTLSLGSRKLPLCWPPGAPCWLLTHIFPPLADVAEELMGGAGGAGVIVGPACLGTSGGQ